MTEITRGQWSDAWLHATRLSFLTYPQMLALKARKRDLARNATIMPWIDVVLDLSLKREIESFASKNLPLIYKLIEKYGNKKTVIVFKDRAQADAYVAKI